MPHLLSEGCAEGLEVRFEKPDVAAHHAEMGNLLSLDPEVHGLDAHTQVHSSVVDGEGKFFVNEGYAQCASSRRTDFGEVLRIHAYL